MSTFNCFRCGYVCIRVSDMKLHLSRKNICKPILRDIILDEHRHNILSGLNFNDIENNSEMLHSAPFCSIAAPFCSILLQNGFYVCGYCERKYKYLSKSDR